MKLYTGMARRKLLLGGAAGLLCAPAIVRAGDMISLMGAGGKRRPAAHRPVQRGTL